MQAACPQGAGDGDAFPFLLLVSLCQKLPQRTRSEADEERGRGQHFQKAGLRPGEVLLLEWENCAGNRSAALPRGLVPLTALQVIKVGSG